MRIRFSLWSRHRTCVVVFSAVAELFFLPDDELRQRQTLSNLHRRHFQPLKDQIVHGVANCVHLHEQIMFSTSQAHGTFVL